MAKRIMVTMLALVIAFTLCGTAFATEIDSTNTTADSITIRELQELVIRHLQENHLAIKIGTNEYYAYIVEQLIEGSDKVLSTNEHYDLIHAYMANYKLRYEDQHDIA